MEWWQLKEEYLKPIGGFLLLPYVLYKEIKEQTDLWKAKGHSRAGGRGETGELRALIDWLGRYREEAPQRREALVQGIVQHILRPIVSEADVVEWKRQDGEEAESFLYRCTHFCLIRLSLLSAYLRKS
jgi:hypothetical protein